MQGYLLFHAIAEVFAVVIAWSALTVAWNSRRYTKHSFFAFMGVALACVGTLDLLHMLAYSGMGVFRNAGSNLPTQLWIAGRYVWGASLLLAPSFLSRKVRFRWFVVFFAPVTAGLVAAVFAGRFPRCYLDPAGGLTGFKIASEYIVCALIATGMLRLHRRRTLLPAGVLKTLLWAMALSIAAELVFTLYVSVEGMLTVMGHVLKIGAFALLYRALIVTGLRRPYDVLFSNLAESEARHRMLANVVEMSSQAFGQGYPDGRLGIVNTAFEELTGYSEQELRSIDWAKSLTPPEWRELEAEKLRELHRTGEPIRYEKEYMRKDGTRVPVELLVHLERDESGAPRYYYSFITDTTERRRAEDELRKSEQKYRLLFDRNPDGVFALNHDGLFTDVNPACERIASYAAAEMMQMTFMDLCAPDMLEATVAQFRRSRDELARTEMETAIIRNDGRRVEILVTAWPVVVDGQVASVHGTVKDITERKNTEEQLRRLSHFPEENPNVVLRATGGCDILYANDAAKRWLKRHVWDEGAQLPEPVAALVRDAGAQRGVIDREIADTEGQTYWLSAVQPAGEQYVNLYGRDITERKRAEKALHEINETLEQRVQKRTAEVRRQADGLRALATQLTHAEQQERKRLAKIVHDHIQQLIVAARMQLEWIKRDRNPEHLQATVEGIDAILHEAFDASRNLSIDLCPPVLHESGLVGGLNWLAARMQDKHQLVVHLEVDNRAEPHDEETRLLLFECVRELLFNVVKHGQVQEAHVTLMCGEPGRMQLLVSDQGAGFDPKTTNERTGSDASFGLFSIRERLDYIGGSMDISSEPGQGTRIVLTAPLARPSGPVPKSQPGGRDSERGEPVRVGPVDDHSIVREGLHGLLEFEPDIVVVGEAEDGPTAVALAREQQPDVVIMDVNLGDTSGVEATRQIMAAAPDAKVVGLSMHHEHDVASAMRDAGAVAFLTKGGPSEDLIAAIRVCAGGGLSNPPAPGPEATAEPAAAAEDTIRVMLADDYMPLRHLLVTELGAEPDIEIVAEAADGPAVLKRVIETSPDVLVLDVSMPAMDAEETIRRLREEDPHTRIITHSAHDEASGVPEAMVQAGAHAHVVKGTSCDELLRVIRECGHA